MAAIYDDRSRKKGEKKVYLPDYLKVHFFTS